MKLVSEGGHTRSMSDTDVRSTGTVPIGLKVVLALNSQPHQLRYHSSSV